MTTPIFLLEEWQEAQAQPQVTVSEALRVVEALSQLVIIDRDLTVPPGSPADGDCYIPATGATGDWATHDDEVAIYSGTSWVFRAARNGWKAYVADEYIDIRYLEDSPSGWSTV